MITVSPSAAEQIRKSAIETNSENLSLRIAAKVALDESIDYGMGFDQANDNDIRNVSEGIDIVVAPGFADLVQGMHIDYVELEPGNFTFIFQNPNDPSYKPPKET